MQRALNHQLLSGSLAATLLIILSISRLSYSHKRFSNQLNVVRHKPNFGRAHLQLSQVSDSLLDAADISTAPAFISSLNKLKKDGRFTKWNSTLLYVTPITKFDVQFVSRTSFSSDDYFSDIVSGAKSSGQSNRLEAPFIAATAFCFLFSSVVVPQLDIPVMGKNILGLTTLIAPFVLIILSIAAPGVVLSAQQSISKSSTAAQSERILYHEAGHFIAGYLCGVPILSYDIGGERDAGTTIEIPVSSSGPDGGLEALREKAGNLLIVSMAGMVAETLRFGDSKGGAEDFPFASAVLRLIRTSASDREGCLRWAVMKSLVLLRIHRDALDGVAEAMRQGKTVADCIVAIETADS